MKCLKLFEYIYKDIVFLTPLKMEGVTVCNHDNTLNFTVESEAIEQLYDKSSTIWVLYIMPVVLSLGLVSNGTFLLVVCRIRSMWTTTNAYLVNLAISDITFLIFAVSDKIIKHNLSPVFYDETYLGSIGCCVWMFVVDFAYFASLSLVSLVSLEKYYAICTPVKHRLFKSGRARTIRCILSGWFGSLLLASGLIPAHSAYTTLCTIWPKSEEFFYLPDQISYCGPVSTIAAHIGNGCQTVPFFTGLFFNFSLYFMIIKRLHDRTSPQDQESLNNSHLNINNRTHVRNQVAKMLVVNGVVFFCCLAPFEILSFSRMISGLTGKRLLEDDMFDSLLQASRTMAYMNAALNPFVYCLCNLRYRRAFMSSFSLVKLKIYPIQERTQ